MAPAPTLANGSFEHPKIPKSGDVAQFADASQPDAGENIGWRTTAADHKIEIWSSGHEDVPGTPINAEDGAQFAELNANEVATLFQDLDTVPGTRLLWRLSHRGRLGIDTMALRIGPPPPDTLLGSAIADLTVEQRQFTDGQVWRRYHGDYTVPVGQTKTRFAFVSVSATPPVPPIADARTIGNFVDGIYFAVPEVSVSPSTNDLPLAKGETYGPERVTVTLPKSTTVASTATVNLVASGDIARFVKEIKPVGGNGPFQRDQDHQVKFDVSWVGTLPGSILDQVFVGLLDVLVDGSVDGAKMVKVTVPALAGPPIADEVLPIFPKEDKVVPTPTIATGVPCMILHQVTGCYLQTDDWTPVATEVAQVYNQFPPYTEVSSQRVGWVWVLEPAGDGYLIRTRDAAYGYAGKTDKALYLQASATTDTGDAIPRQQFRLASDPDGVQTWLLKQISGDTYAIASKKFPDYAFAHYGNEAIGTGSKVVCTPMYGKPMVQHYWRIQALPQPLVVH